MRRVGNQGTLSLLRKASPTLNERIWRDACSPLVQGAWAGRLVHFSGLDVLGPTAGAVARLLQDREVELWEGKRIVASLGDGPVSVRSAGKFHSCVSLTENLRPTDGQLGYFRRAPVLPRCQHRFASRTAPRLALHRTCEYVFALASAANGPLRRGSAPASHRMSTCQCGCPSTIRQHLSHAHGAFRRRAPCAAAWDARSAAHSSETRALPMGPGY